MQPFRAGLLASATALAFYATINAAAAQSQSAGLEEITVTAQRRAERLQDIPLAVSAFTPAEMERRNIVETKDLIQYVPNLQGNFNTGLGTANVYFLRGLGNTESVATFDPPIGTYVDEIYIARQNGNNFDFFDLDSIEVLRGPQGTLFGRNTSGGAINIKLRRPAETFGGSAEIGYGRFNRTEARGEVDAPVSDKVLTQFGAFYAHQDGYVNDITTGQHLNGQLTWGARGAFTAKLSDTVKWNVGVNHTYDNELNTLNFTCTIFNSGVASPGAPANCSGRFAINGLRIGASPNLSNVLIGLPSSGAPGTIVANASFVPATLSDTLPTNGVGNRVHQTIVSSNLEAAFEGVTLNFITGYVYLDEKYLLEFQDGRIGRSLGAPNLVIPYLVDQNGVIAPNGALALDVHNHSQEITQEIRAAGKLLDDRLRYVAGAYYYHDSNWTDYADVSTSFLAPVPPQTAASPRPYRTTALERLLTNSTTSVAGYAQADYYLTQQFFATAGIRYTDERKSMGIQDLRDPRAIPVLNGVLRPDLRLDTANMAAFGFPTKLVTKIWTPHFALNYKVNDDVLVFATATRGFRSGGWNVRGGDISSFAPFFAEKVWSYEAGTKSEWLDRRLRANVTLFDNEVSAFQLPSSFVQANGLPTFITQNAGDFRDRGVEAELQALPADHVTLFTTIGYQNAYYRNIPASTLSQQAACLAARAAGQTGSGTVCAVGIVTYDGRIATPARTPHWTIAVGGSYEIPTSMGVTIIPSVNVAYQSASESAASNLSYYINAAGNVNVTKDGSFIAGSHTAAFAVVNASLAVETDDKLWRATADCSNCFGKVWSQSAVSGYSFISPPGTWTIRLKRKF